ncbi:MAG: bifunctional 4-hydroxy-2-oxoglutarate aldolase/2-dehydro-3-deoxy-phosphogluconate aldolase [Rhodobacteraceae bacterium]|nr:bifunctional 4-hydroxy-2-oxoglutarate aldolase/2-dehydro-3-deoxy-phosphogluconate aldolase [Paracoccaceae bacterium]
MNNDIIDRIFNVGVLPVVVIDDPSKAVLMAEALVRGNMPVAEITFRTAGAAQAIANIKHEFPDLLVGAGTVLNVDSVKAAKDAGADFALAPGVNPVVLAAAKSAGMPFFPGISSPTDIETALQAGANILKFFPAEASGGISKLATIASPYVMEKIRFIPTGGIKPATASVYLSSPLVLSIGGTWIATQTMIENGEWDMISKNAAEAVAIAAKARGAAV